MKNIAVSAAVIATLATSSVFASGLTLDVYGDRAFSNHNKGQSTQGVEVAYGFHNGLALSAEGTTKKDLDLGAAWKFEFGESSYIKPSIGYVFKKSANDLFDHKEIDAHGSTKRTAFESINSDVAKLGLEFGSTNGNLISSARIRYEIDTKKFNAAYQDSTVTAKGRLDGNLFEGKVRSETARLDLMVGYNFFDTVTVTAKSINKYELNKDLKTINDRLDARNDQWSGELKATVTTFDGVAPYVQYTHNKAVVKGGKDDQIIKLGAKFSF